jgi:hypothetical protein
MSSRQSALLEALASVNVPQPAKAVLDRISKEGRREFNLYSFFLSSCIPYRFAFFSVLCAS